MNLKKIKKEYLIFSGDIGDDRINTYLVLDDYDWMNYSLITRFKTEELGTLKVKFEFFGATTSIMIVEQDYNAVYERVVYEYPTDIFQKYIIKFLTKHIASWDKEYAFYGEDEVIEFFNTVLENGTIKS